MWGQQHICTPHERMMPEVGRILSQHVERRAANEPAIERVHEVGLDEERAAGNVDEERLALHLFEGGTVEEPATARVQVGVQADDVRARE
jgi:hypothetical protein